MNRLSSDSFMQLIQADFAVAGIKAFVTTRQGGMSSAPFDSLNLGDHVGDDVAVVQRNRTRLQAALPSGCSLKWLTQVHGTEVVSWDEADLGTQADSIWTNQTDQVCMVLTADCLPVLFASRDAQVVAAAHAGWRGLASGVLESTVQALPVSADQLMAWLGPAIGPTVYEVGAEVRAAFVDVEPENQSAFSRRGSRWLADLYQLARVRLERLGVHQIAGGHFCTFTQQELFFSHRRDGARSGRMASLIWRE